MTLYSKSQTTVEGLDELIKAFMDLGEEALPHLKKASDEAGQSVLNKAKQKAPVDTRNLQTKLKLAKARKSSKYPYRVFSKVTFGKGAAYAVPVELGHKLVMHGKTVGAVKERPFLRPAADESKAEVVSAIADGINKALEQMGGKK